MNFMEFVEDIRLGVSSACLFPMNTEKAILELIKMGYRKFEIFLNSDCELSKEYIIELKKILKMNISEVVSIHPYTSELENSLFFSRYQRRFIDGIEYYKKYFKCAEILGAKYVVLHGPSSTNKMGVEFIVERLNLIQKEARKYGVEILLENVARCYMNTPEKCIELIENGIECGFVLDFKQASRVGHGIDEYIHSMGMRLKHIHASDQNEKNNCLAIGFGDLDYLSIINLLYKVQYKGSVVMELYSEDAKNDELVKSKSIYDNLLELNFLMDKIY